ncbi:MAG: aldose 1-epimerase family protein [Lachnospiraceae bacterium]|nr:aldose 1-epimerase family protein [Lachnospiraceae bacterium]
MEYAIKNEYLTVTASDKGAELQSIKSADGTEYLWQADPAIWGGKAPNIFPYVARLTDGTFTLDGKSYNMKIHGLVRYNTLTLETPSCGSLENDGEEEPEAGRINLAADRMTFRLDSNAQTREQYPFDFIYRITYALKGKTLEITSTVENTGDNRMYFGLGGHPGFRVPMEEGLTFEDYYLEFDRPSHPYRVGFTDACFLTGQDRPYPLENDVRIPLHHDLFDHDAVVLKHAPKTVKIASDKGQRSVTVHYPEFMYVGFWHAIKKEAPYVCVEPWSSLPSRDGIIEDLSCQSDLIGLDGGKTYTNTWTVEIR